MRWLGRACTILFEAIDESDDALHADDGSGDSGTGNGSILVVGEGDCVLLIDDNSGALQADIGSDVPSTSGDGTCLIIGPIGTDNSLITGDVLAAITDSGTIG
jgi:hypothetical protein